MESYGSCRGLDGRFVESLDRFTAFLRVPTHGAQREALLVPAPVTGTQVSQRCLQAMEGPTVGALVPPPHVTCIHVLHQFTGFQQDGVIGA